MQPQNFKNHSTLNSLSKTQITLYVSTILFVLCAIVNLFYPVQLNMLFILLAISLVSGYFSYRTFSLKAQDRAIRAEENLRHYVLTGKLLDKNLRMQQIVALRFASDEEFVELAQRALKENMGNRKIKQAIKNWKPDYHRA